MDLESVADELYGLPPEEFVATRTAREKAAKSAGDSELAAALHRLAKPSAAAWLANQLVRRHREEMTPLLELGANLREAMAALSGPQLRELGRQQHQLIASLVGRARDLAGESGRTVSADAARAVEETLHAALADEAMAAALLSGRLTETLRRSGLGDVDEVAAIAPRAPAARRKTPGKNGALEDTGVETTAHSGRAGVVDAVAERRAANAERQRAQARAALEQAQAASDSALAARDRARTGADDAKSELDAAGEVVQRLRAELDHAVAQRDRLAREHRSSLTALEKAERLVDAAGHRLDRARS